MLNIPETVRGIIPMLQYARPHMSREEGQFVQRFVLPLGAEIDGFGNCIKRIGTAPVMWSCHTDTVDQKGGRRSVRVKKDGGAVSLESKKEDCLGADDAVGVWLMGEMIMAEVPGLYIFHAAEEIGGKGSAWIAKETPNLLKDIKYAIALDRKGYHSVITHQFGRRCCSDEFAAGLAAQLLSGYEPDPTGLFTDTANYKGLIGECTNISVGYHNAHSNKEWLNLTFLAELREVLLRIDISKLPYVRKPGEVYEIEALTDLVRRYPNLAASVMMGGGVTSEAFGAYAKEIFGLNKEKKRA